MWIIAQDGSGDFTTIQAAVDAAVGGGRAPTVLLIRPGVYRERLVVNKDNLRLVGEDSERTIITHSGCAKDLDADGHERGTFLSFTVIVTGRNVTMENLTIRNDAGDGRVAGQAVALYAAGDRGAYRHCRLIAHQDTLFTGPVMPIVAQEIAPRTSDAEFVPSCSDCLPTRSREYFEDCFIQGDIDFIFGAYRCWFERCTLYMNARGGYYTASNAAESQPYGYVFHDCRLTGECPDGMAYLGRPWRRFSSTLFLNCEMDACVSPLGFCDWDETRVVTERYGEYGTRGARASQDTRHPAQKRLTAEEALRVTVPEVIGGWDHWRPDRPEPAWRSCGDPAVAETAPASDRDQNPVEEDTESCAVCSPSVRKESTVEWRESAERFARRMAREDVNLHGFILSVRGQEAARAYYAPYREGQPHRLYSVSKTMTALAIGMLMDEGKLGLDDHIVDYFRDWLPISPDPRLTRLRIRDMLRMATCYRKTAYRQGVDENWAKAFFTSIPDHEPGTVFCYDTGCSQVLAALVRRLSGQGVFDFLEERLFRPLGLRDERYWLRDPSGCEQGGSGLCMSLRDIHRVAQCLADGGRGLEPAWFVTEMTRRQIDTVTQTNEEERCGYGWQCWRTRAGWSMYGMGGQLCIVCPDKEIVFSTIGDTRLDPFGVQRIYNAFFEEIYPCVAAPVQEPAVLRFGLRPLPNAADREHDAAGPYTFAPGQPLGLRTLRLEGGVLRLDTRAGTVVLPAEPGKVHETAFPGHPEVPALVSAGWTESGALHLRCFAAGDDPCGFDMLVAFHDAAVTVQCRRSEDPLTDDFDGLASGYMN